MSRKSREREYALEKAHAAWLQESAARAFSSIKTTTLIKPKTVNQAAYIRSIKNNIITLAHGSPGTGKTLLALHTAVQLLNDENSNIEKIIYIRSNVGMSQERDLGAMPGGFGDKVSLLALPVLDNLIEFMDETQAKFLVSEECNKLEVTTISYLRGRSLNNAIIIVDESQNCTPDTIKTILTRLGVSSKLVLLGDRKQRDLAAKYCTLDGLGDAITRLYDIEGVGVVEFTPDDCQRNEIIPAILARYEN